MTPKHFEALAAMVKYLDEPITKEMLAKELGRVCHSFNSNFDTDRFERACDAN